MIAATEAIVQRGGQHGAEGERSMRRRPKPAVLPLRPVPAGYDAGRARCPACAADGAEVVGMIARRLVFRCGGCGVKFHRADTVLLDSYAP
jgi:hypothetical protein